MKDTDSKRQQYRAVCSLRRVGQRLPHNAVGVLVVAAKVFWPEVEANYTYWPHGTHEGLNQLFITPGMVLGKFSIWERVGLMLGARCQVAVSDKPIYHRNIIVTGRIPS